MLLNPPALGAAGGYSLFSGAARAAAPAAPPWWGFADEPPGRGAAAPRGPNVSWLRRTYTTARRAPDSTPTPATARRSSRRSFPDPASMFDGDTKLMPYVDWVAARIRALGGGRYFCLIRQH